MLVVSAFCMGCSTQTVSTMSGNGLGFPEDVDRFNEEVIEALQSSSSDALLGKLSDELRAAENIVANVEALQAEVQSHPVEFQSTVTQMRSVSEGGRRTTTYLSRWESPYGDQFLTLDLTVFSEEECCQIVALNSYRDDERPSTLNDWTNAPLSMGRILFLLLMMANVAFIILTLIMCVRDKTIERRKWLWFLFILFGTWGATMNWTTGAISPNFLALNAETGSFSFHIIKIQLLGAGIDKSGVYAPWILEIGFPLGACIYWFRRRSYRA